MSSILGPSGADRVLEEIRQFFAECEQYVPVVHYLNEFLLQIPEARENDMYQLGEYYRAAADRCNEHLDEINAYLKDLAVNDLDLDGACAWQGDRAAQAVQDKLDGYRRELVETSEALAEMSGMVQEGAAAFEMMKWMAITNLVMLAYVVVQSIMLIWTGVGAGLIPVGVAACRVGIGQAAATLRAKIAALGLRRGLWEATKAGSRRTVGAGVRNAGTRLAAGGWKGVGKTAGVAGSKFGGFNALQQGGVTTIMALEGNVHGDKMWNQLVMGTLDGFITGALGGPLARARPGALWSSTAYMVGQFGDNLVQVGRDQLFLQFADRATLEKHGWFSGKTLTWDSLTQDLAQAALQDLVLDGGGEMRRVRAEFNLQRAANDLFSTDPGGAGAGSPTGTSADTLTGMPTQLPPATTGDNHGAPSDLSPAGGPADRRDTDTSGSAGPPNSAELPGPQRTTQATADAGGPPIAVVTASPPPVADTADTGTRDPAAGPPPGHGAGSTDAARAAEPVQRHAGSVGSVAKPVPSDPAALPSGAGTVPSDPAALPSGPEAVPSGAETLPSDAEPVGSDPEPTRSDIEIVEDERPDRPGERHNADPTATGISDGQRVNGDQGARAADGSRDTGLGEGQRREPRLWEWKKKADLAYEQMAAQGLALSPLRTGGSWRSLGTPAALDAHLVQRALDTSPDSLSPHGRRLRTFIQEHYTRVDDGGVRRPLGDAEIADKSRSLLRIPSPQGPSSPAGPGVDRRTDPAGDAALRDKVRVRFDQLFRPDVYLAEQVRREESERQAYETALADARQAFWRLVEEDPGVQAARRTARGLVDREQRCRAEAATFRVEAATAHDEARVAREQAERARNEMASAQTAYSFEVRRLEYERLKEVADQREIAADRAGEAASGAQRRADDALEEFRAAWRDVDERVAQIGVEQEPSWRLLNVEVDARHRTVNEADPGPTTSALTGRDVPPPVWRTWRDGLPYETRPVLRIDLDRLKRKLDDGHGGLRRNPDPRGEWLYYLNAFGIEADPTRTINPAEALAAAFDTYVHGRPTVASARTFDASRDGDPKLPLVGEPAAFGRFEELTGARYQSLAGDLSRQPPADAPLVVADAIATVYQRLLAGGSGSFASIVVTRRDGAEESWAAVRHDKETVLFFDPMRARVVRAEPGDGGLRYVDEQTGDNLTRLIDDHETVVAVDGLVLDGDARPMPFLDRPPGHDNERPLTPAYLSRQPADVRAALRGEASYQAMLAGHREQRDAVQALLRAPDEGTARRARLLVARIYQRVVHLEARYAKDVAWAAEVHHQRADWHRRQAALSEGDVGAASQPRDGVLQQRTELTIEHHRRMAEAYQSAGDQYRAVQQRLTEAGETDQWEPIAGHQEAVRELQEQLRSMRVNAVRADPGHSARTAGAKKATPIVGGGTPFKFEQLITDPEWSAEATQFEQRLGSYFFNSPAALDAARTAVRQLRDVLVALHLRSDANQNRVDVGRWVDGVFLRDDAVHSAGQVGSKASLDELLEHGNVRELMTAFYNAAYYNEAHRGTLAKVVLDVIDNQRWDEAREAGLDIAEIEAMRRTLDGSLGAEVLGGIERGVKPDWHRFARDPFATYHVLRRHEGGLRNVIEVTSSQAHRRPRSDDDTLARTPDDYAGMGAPLGRFERAYVESVRGDLLLGDTALPWREGRAAYDLSSGRWVSRATSDGLPVATGISATTTRMLTAVRVLGLGRDVTEHFLGALMGWMLPVRDHSLYEIVRGAQLAGVGISDVANPRVRPNAVDFYRSLPSIDLHTLRTEVLPDGLFPHEARYLARVVGWTVDESIDRIWSRLRSGQVKASHVEKWLRHHGIDAEDRAAVRDLSHRLSRAHLIALAAYTHDADVMINNVTRAQLWTGGVSESVVRRQFTNRVKRLAADGDSRAGKGKGLSNMPKLLTEAINGGPGGAKLRDVYREAVDSEDFHKRSIKSAKERAHRAGQAAVEARQKGDSAEVEKAEIERRKARDDIARATAERARAIRQREAAWTSIQRRLDELVPALFDEMRLHADMLHDALARLPTVGSPDRPVLVYRGDGLLPVHSPQYGSRFYPRASIREFISTSRDLTVATRFLSRTRPAVIVYRLTGRYARDMSIFSRNLSEQEVILPPWSKVRRYHDPELENKIRAEVKRNHWRSSFDVVLLEEE